MISNTKTKTSADKDKDMYTGLKLSISKDNQSVISMICSESVTVKSGSGTGRVKEFDIQTSDGVIHAIDTVI